MKNFIKFLGLTLIAVSLLGLFSYKFEALENTKKYEVFIAPEALEEMDDEDLDEYENPYYNIQNCVASFSLKGMDYPLMQSNDNQFYLKHDYLGNEDRQGSIFLDCNTSLDDPYCIIYGHNMLSTQTMFYELYNVVKGDKLYINASTYTCIAVYDTTISDAAFKIGYQYDDTFTNFLNAVSDEDFINEEIYGKHVVSVVTCNRSYAGKDGRRVCMFIDD